jgi:ATP-dependent Lon protease
MVDPNYVVIAAIEKKYADDLLRLSDLQQLYGPGKGIRSILDVDESNHPIRLYHFEKAIQALETNQAKQRREMEEALIIPSPPQGVSCGLYASEDGTGGIITVQCSVRPIISGERQVSVTGNSTSAVIGQVVVPDESVRQSAENATEAVSSMLWAVSRVSLGGMHMHFQVRSILEGAPGQGVSGPSAGLALVLALISELSGVAISPSIVPTGTVGVKLDIGPVGGLGGYGAQTGKVVGVLKSQKIRVTDLLLPAVNFEVAADEMRILAEEGVNVHPVTNVSECLQVVFGLSQDELLGKIKERVGRAAS